MLTDQDIDLLFSFLDNNDKLFESWCKNAGACDDAAKSIIDGLVALEKDGILTSDIFTKMPNE